MSFYQLESFTGCRSIGYLVRRIHNLMLPRIEAQFTDAEITFSQWVVLMSLRDGNADTCADIANHMNHDAGAVTRLVDQLEKRGLLARVRSAKDRRVVHLKLLPKGKTVAKALTPRAINFWNRMLGEFTAAESSALIDMLTRLNTRLEAEPLAARPAAKAKLAKPKKAARKSK